MEKNGKDNIHLHTDEQNARPFSSEIVEQNSNGHDKLQKSDRASDKLIDKTADKTTEKVNDKQTAKSTDKDAKKHKSHKKRNLWSIKITIVSLFLSAFISFLSELTASSEHIIVTVLLLFFLILCSILFDGIGVAATSCDITPFISMASRKVYGAKTAMWLVKNNEKVANVCNDVIGDIFGIISGACAAAIVLKIVVIMEDGWQRWLTIGISSVVSALTIGGKAFLKNIAITNSREFVLFVSRILAVFNPEERKRRKKQKEKKLKYEAQAAQNAEHTHSNENDILPDKTDDAKSVRAENGKRTERKED